MSACGPSSSIGGMMQRSSSPAAEIESTAVLTSPSKHRAGRRGGGEHRLAEEDEVEAGVEEVLPVLAEAQADRLRDGALAVPAEERRVVQRPVGRIGRRRRHSRLRRLGDQVRKSIFTRFWDYKELSSHPLERLTWMQLPFNTSTKHVRQLARNTSSVHLRPYIP